MTTIGHETEQPDVEQHDTQVQQHHDTQVQQQQDTQQEDNQTNPIMRENNQTGRQHILPPLDENGIPQYDDLGDSKGYDPSTRKYGFFDILAQHQLATAWDDDE